GGDGCEMLFARARIHLEAGEVEEGLALLAREARQGAIRERIEESPASAAVVEILRARLELARGGQAAAATALRAAADLRDRRTPGAWASLRKQAEWAAAGLEPGTLPEPF